MATLFFAHTVRHRVGVEKCFKMKLVLCLIGAVLFSVHGTAFAQGAIYRCGNEYTNTVTEAQAKECKLISGGNVTIVQGVKPAPKSGGSAGSRTETPDQRAKESDARMILEAELKKAEARQSELLKDFNNGEPEKQGPETRNHQKYLDRVAEMKAAIARNDADIAGIKREIARLGPSSGAK